MKKQGNYRNPTAEERRRQELVDDAIGLVGIWLATLAVAILAAVAN